MKTKVYIETTVVSYFTSRMSGDLVTAARQKITRDTWPMLMSEFDVYVSAAVVQEASRGDPGASEARRKSLEGIPVLNVNDSARALARRLLEDGVIPETHLEDAIHVAVAAANGMDFLLTWNFTHINNAFTRLRIREVVQSEGYTCPEICSPEEFLGEDK